MKAAWDVKALAVGINDSVNALLQAWVEQAERAHKAVARAAELEGLLAQLAELWDSHAYHDEACSVRVAGGRRGCNCGYAEASTKVQAALAPLPTPHMGEGVQE